MAQQLAVLEKPKGPERRIVHYTREDRRLRLYLATIALCKEVQDDLRAFGQIDPFAHDKLAFCLTVHPSFSMTQMMSYVEALKVYYMSTYGSEEVVAALDSGNTDDVRDDDFSFDVLIELK